MACQWPTCQDTVERQDNSLSSTNVYCGGQVTQLLLGLVTNVFQLANRVIHTWDLSLHCLGYTRGSYLLQPYHISTSPCCAYAQLLCKIAELNVKTVQYQQQHASCASLKRRRLQQHQIVCPGCNASSKVGIAGAEWRPPQSPLKLQTRCREPQDLFPETQPVPTVCMAPFARSARLQKTLYSTRNTTFTTTLAHCMQQQGLQAGSCCKSKLTMSRI